MRKIRKNAAAAGACRGDIQRRQLGTIAAIGALVLIGTAVADVSYDFVDLGTGVPTAINSVSAVLGQGVQDDSEPAYFVVDPDGTTRHAPTLPTGASRLLFNALTDPFGAHDVGLAWGSSIGPDASDEFGNRVIELPVVWDPHGSLIHVPLPSWATNGFVLGVAPDGWTYTLCANTTIGASGSSTDHYGVVTWNPDSPNDPIEVPGVNGYSSVTCLVSQFTTAGKIVVQAYTPPASATANITFGPVYVWDRTSGATTALDGAVGNFGMKLNDHGEAVGVGGDGHRYGLDERASYWSAAGVRTDLHALLPATAVFSYATQITSSGWVAGTYGGSGIANSDQFVDNETYVFGGSSAPSVFAWNARTAEFHDLAADVEAAGGIAATLATVTEDGLVVGHMWMRPDTGGGINSGPNGDYWRPAHVFVWDAQYGFTDISADLVTSDTDGAYVQGVNRGGKVIFAMGPSYSGEGISPIYSWHRSHGIESRTLLDVQAILVGNNTSNFYAFNLALGAFDLQNRSFNNMNSLGQVVAAFLLNDTNHISLATPRGATAPGPNVAVQPDAANPTTSITFAGIAAPGETTVQGYTAENPNAPPAPANFQLAGTDSFLEVATTATLASGAAIHLAIHYDDTGMSAADEGQVRLLHYTSGQWVDATDYNRSGGYLDTTNNIVYGVTTSLSPFALTLDRTPPTLHLPEDVTVEATDASGAVATFSAPTATDNADASPTVTCSATSGATFPIGTTTVNCTATDAAGNVAHGSFQIVVQDTTAPTIASHADVTVDATDVAGTAVTFTSPTATDLVDGSVSVTCSPASDSLFAVGATTVTCTSTDAHGNVATSTFTVTVKLDPAYLADHVAKALAALVPSGSKSTDKVILDALKDLEKSRKSGLWVDDCHLTRNGAKVFDDLKEAIEDLLSIKNPPAGVTSAINDLVEVARVLAQTAVDSACGVADGDRDWARSKIEDAGTCRSQGRHSDAVGCHCDAWKRVQGN